MYNATTYLLQSEEVEPTPVLALGPDCYSLIQAVSELSQRKITVSSPGLSGNMCGSAGFQWLEAGPLLLSTGGVCYLGDWAKFGCGRSSAASQIISGITCGYTSPSFYEL